MKIQVVVYYEIEPELAAQLLADPFPNTAVDKWLCENSPMPDKDVAYMEPSLGVNARDVFTVLGKHLAQSAVDNAKQLTNINV